MKTIIISLITFLLLTSCGRDGRDGRAYLSFSWDVYVDEYSDDNYSIPVVIEELTYYDTEPGTYSYEYYCSDGIGNYWGYEGTYTITIFWGEEGGFIRDGDDAPDSFYDFDLTGDGSSFHLLKGKKKHESLDKGRINIAQYKKMYVGEKDTRSVKSSAGEITITKKKFLLLKN